jgi:hypothetical protein
MSMLSLFHDTIYVSRRRHSHLIRSIPMRGYYSYWYVLYTIIIYYLFLFLTVLLLLILLLFLLLLECC